LIAFLPPPIFVVTYAKEKARGGVPSLGYFLGRARKVPRMAVEMKDH